MVEIRLKGEWPDELSLEELVERDTVITKGINQFEVNLGKQKTANDYFFYEGSIEGFEECKQYSKLSEFEGRIKELQIEQIREMSKSKVTDPLIREELKIYSKEDRTNSQEIYKTKGMRTQVESVYEHLKGYRAAKMINSGKAVIVHKNKNKS